MMIDHLWAKHSEDLGTYPLLCHLLDTACAAGEVADSWLREGLQQLLFDALGERWRQAVMFAAAVHDLGKANPVFQGQLASPYRPEWAAETLEAFPEENYPRVRKSRARKPGIRRHEQVSFFHLAGENWDRLPADEAWLSLTALGHHGRFSNVANREVRVTNKLTFPGWADLREQLLSEIETAIGISRDDLPREVDTVPTILLSGITVIADRLASGAGWVTEQSMRMNAGELHPHEGGRWIAASADRMRERMRQHLGVYEPLADPLREILRGFTPRGAQKELIKAGRGMVAVMAPTGSGKTEAALLRHEEDPERLLFFLPTVATTNAIMRRIQAIYQNTNNIATLAHGLATLEDFYARGMETGEVGRQGSGGRDQSLGGLHPSDFTKAGSGRLLAPITVGTVDQGLMSALPMKWTHLRLLALANAHIVIDEVHTLDSYQTQLLSTVMEWLGRVGARVTLLSATLPSQQLEELIAAYEGEESKVVPCFPSILEIPSSHAISAEPSNMVWRDLEAREYVIDYDVVTLAPEDGWGASIHEHLRWIREVRKAYPRARIGVFVNTIQRAQEISAELQNSGERVLTLHSLMTAGHRAEIAEELDVQLGAEGAGEGLCLVGTQAIEASLDIDLDIASTDLAPAPSLVQRAGRVWRRNDERRKERIDTENLTLHIVQSQAEAWNLPYPRAVMQRTAAWLAENGNRISCPEDIQGFVEAAWVALEDVSTEADEEYIAQHLQATMKARTATWRLADLEMRTNYQRLFPLTNQDQLDPEKVSTRLIERESSALILCDPHVYGIPGALPWTAHKAVEQLRQSRSHATIRRFLQAGLNTSSARVKKAVSARGLLLQSDDIPALLRGRYLIEVEPPFRYNALAGLQLVEESE